MRALTILFLVLIAAFALPVWPYSEGWSYYFTGVTVFLVLALLIAPLFRPKNAEGEAKAQRTKVQPEFLDDAGLASKPMK